MNADTVTLIERPYQEIVDDILTAIVGGVVNEPILFDVKEDLYPLAEPASDIRSVTGTVSVPDASGRPEPAQHTFQKLVDFVFSEGDNAVVWQAGGAKPDDETVFYVDYLRPNSRSPLSDVNVGSVTRTLGEAVGREIATVYKQIHAAYLSAFVDTAEGRSLDLVVAILGVTRKTKEYASGLVTFFRDPAVDGNVAIPEGTLVRTADAKASFAAVEPRTLQRGQPRVDVPVRAIAAGADGVVKAGEIVTLVQPMAGIARVSNVEATFLGAENETDEQLRLRAKAALRALGKATIAALAKAVDDERATLAEVYDPNSPEGKRTAPGSVVLLVESEPERFPSLRGRIEETRAAGVLVTLAARYIYVKPRVAATLAAGLTPEGKVKVVDDMIAAMQAYVDGLTSGDAAEGAKLLDAMKNVKGVGAVTIKDVVVWQADVGGPDAAPTGSRTPNRALLVGPSGAAATDAEIEAGTFRVEAVVDGAKWWIVLDVERADIAVTEG